MRIRALGPGRIHCITEDGDPVVLTAANGDVIWGPRPAPPPGARMVIDYDGPRVGEFCWGVLNPDGTLGWQSQVVGRLLGYDRINLDFDRQPDDYLTAVDRKWLSRMWSAVRYGA